MDYLDNVEKQLKTDARDVDVTYSVFFGGKPGVTLSKRAALEARTGHKGWCIFCKILSVLVQKNHCEVVLNNGTIPTSAYWRAGVCFVGITIIIFGAIGAILIWIR